ncbi:MAG: DUF402 domain-containing protein [Bacilli bacterium]|nr:DUF402 domain-containing protein [Bacilli bacterium]
MSDIELGKKYFIHSYKHDGTIHRSWDEAVLLDIKDNYLVFGNDRTIVQEADGRTWKTKEPAIMYFFEDRWFNIIAQKKENGIYYYCNMASPYVLEYNTIKYIDYDLDLRVFADGTYKVLDRSEYKFHKEKMNYPEEIDLILKEELKSLILLVKEKKYGFDREKILNYYKLYVKYK